MPDDPHPPPTGDSSEGAKPHHERAPEQPSESSAEHQLEPPPEHSSEPYFEHSTESHRDQGSEHHFDHPPESPAETGTVEVYAPERGSTLSDEHEEEETGGGPVKTFLEHLEDLRWTIVKCAISIALGVITCLSAGKPIIAFVAWPLRQAQKLRTDPAPRVVLTLGTNFFARVPLRDFPVPNAPTNQDTYLRLALVTIGDQKVLGLVNDTNPPASAMDNIRVDLKTFSPGAGFVIATQIAIFGGLTVSAPFVLFFIGQFVLPAMHVHEKRFLYRVSGFATLLFFLGIAFCYLVMLPITFSTTTLFSNWLGFSSDEWKADDYMSFTMWFLLGMGVSFELPLVLLTLVKIGLLTSRQLNQFRMYWVVAGLVVAGFVTPDGNPLTMLLMFLPLHLLYEISVVIAWFWGREERAAEKSLGT